ncbi:hypothetical protein C8Q80DRAFT_1150204 [Daedaleopsis nitida]|nr:hypothetical protein C8Q80DRAFT_1150204 [Daedaleopsis nitida]
MTFLLLLEPQRSARGAACSCLRQSLMSRPEGPGRVEWSPGTSVHRSRVTPQLYPSSRASVQAAMVASVGLRTYRSARLEPVDREVMTWCETFG